jgi:hypothetical protein
MSYPERKETKSITMYKLQASVSSTCLTAILVFSPLYLQVVDVKFGKYF